MQIITPTVQFLLFTVSHDTYTVMILLSFGCGYRYKRICAIFFRAAINGALLMLLSNELISQTSQCTCPHVHNTPLWNWNVHISVPERCTVGQAVYCHIMTWDMGRCIVGFTRSVIWPVPVKPSRVIRIIIGDYIITTKHHVHNFRFVLWLSHTRKISHV